MTRVRRWVAGRLVAGTRWAVMRLDGRVLDVHEVRRADPLGGLGGVPVTLDPCVPPDRVMIRLVGE